MAKKATKVKSTTRLPLLLCILVISIALLCVVIFRNNPNVLGVTTSVTSKPNMPGKMAAKEGEACGTYNKTYCKKELICAPLVPLYKVINTNPSASGEVTMETTIATTQQRPCLGKSEDELSKGCLPYLPYYGACVKKGVWPPPFLNPTPTFTPKPTEIIPHVSYIPPMETAHPTENNAVEPTSMPTPITKSGHSGFLNNFFKK